MARSTGVYVCEGCGIGGCVDSARLVDVAAADGATVTRTSPAFCLEDVEVIRGDIAEQGLDAVVVAACSPRVNRRVFRFDGTHVRRVNLREHVAWSHAPNDEATEELAADLLRMGIAAVQHTVAPTPYTRDHERAVLVVGSGPAGLSAALCAADAGFAVTLVERETQLGGFLRRLHRGYPSSSPYRELEAVDVDALIERVTSHPGITVHTSSRVDEVRGQPGRFEVTVSSGSGADEVVVGAVVEATGWQPVAAEHFARYGLGTLADVITSIDMEAMAARDRLTRPSDGSRVTRVAILACDGPDDSANLPYTGSVTSMVALKQAMYVREADPDAIVFVVFEDMQTPGRDELYYRRVQEDAGVFLVRGHVTNVGEDAQGALAVSVDTTVLARPVEITADLVVLGVGMVPATSAAGASDGAVPLRYLQGSALPTGRAGFADSNFLCFPHETRRTGIHTAGCLHRSQDIAASRRDGAAAALKAVQVIEKAAVGQAVHPRVGELGFPQFFMQKCTACGRCTQECPFGALELDALRHPVINTNRCRRCGICMGACPVQVISFPDYSVEMLSSMQKVVSLPEDDEERLRILVLACENDAYPALDMVGLNRLQYPAVFRVVPVRCLGSVNSVVAADAVQRGFDGVALLGCRSGPDYQCHFIQGSELLGQRMTNVRETLGRLALEEDRVTVLETSIADSHRLPSVLASFAESIRAMGPNPMKGF
jgi:quinone-modifying oxidoreductase, subunit QmoB